MIKVSRSMKLQVGLMSLLKMSNSKWWWMVQSIQSSIPKWYTTCVKKCDKLVSRRWWQHFSEYYFMMCWITLTPKLSINFLRYCYIIHLCPLKILDKNPTKKCGKISRSKSIWHVLMRKISRSNIYWYLVMAFICWVIAFF